MVFGALLKAISKFQQRMKWKNFLTSIFLFFLLPVYFMADTDVVKDGVFRLFHTIKYMFSVALEHLSEF